MKKDSALWAACRIHRILSQASLRSSANHVPSLSALLAEQRLLKRCWRMLNVAQDRGWTHCVAILQRRVISQLATVHAASTYIPPAHVAQVPAIPDLLCEIRQLSDEFDEVTICRREKHIRVVTEEITLEHVALGAFTIQLDLDRLTRRRDVSAFTIVAENANPAAGDSACTHPHVRDESLCAGDATAPITHALAEGRVGDAFQLINRVLHTYNSASAYVSLEDWNGRPCGDCGHTTSSESLDYCQSCQSDFCNDCMQRCDRCEQSVCLDCSQENDSGDRLCPRCKTLDDQESEETYEQEETSLSDDPIHEPTEETPQPPTETTHAHPDPQPPEARPAAGELPSSPPDGNGTDAQTDASTPQAA